MSETFFVPYHLLEQLLVRLPAELLVQFKRVTKTKTWSALISSKSFSQKHLNFSIMAAEEDASSTKIIIKTFDMYEVEWRKSFKLLTANVDSPIDFLGTEKEIYHPLQEYNEIPIKLVGSCHGLVCIRNSYDGLCLYNPCINKQWKVPYSQSGNPRRLSQDSSVYGFGYNDFHNDFKVVRLIPSEQVCEIYSLKANLWVIINDFPINIPNRSHSGVFGKSHVHWLHMMFGPENPIYTIVGIPLRAHNSLSIMNLPATVAHHTPKNLGFLDGCLALFTCSRKRTSKIQVWVMKQYGVQESWTLLTNIDMEEVVRDTYLYGLRLRPHEEIVIQHSKKQIAWYDMRNESVIKVKLPGKDNAFKEIYPIRYSLIDLNHIRSEGASSSTS